MILDRFNLTDRVAIVTGAGKGIGAGCAFALADAGAHVALAARTESDLEAVAEQIDARHRRALVVPTDVTEREQLEHLVTRTADELGGVDIVVNNAGGWDPRPLLQTSPRNMEAAFKFNVLAAFSLTQLCIPHLAKRGNGSVINISSARRAWSSRASLPMRPPRVRSQ